jgi:undecaprenyl-diphosphatase
LAKPAFAGVDQLLNMAALPTTLIVMALQAESAGVFEAECSRRRASVTAFIAIYGLLHYLERRRTWIFVWYRLIFGVGIVLAVLGGFWQN